MAIHAETDYIVGVDVVAYALGLTETRIQQLAGDDVIEKLEHGKYSLLEATRGYCEFLRQRQRGSTDTKEEKAERIKLTRARRRMAELAHNEQIGAVVDSKTIQKHHSALAHILKNNLETIPDRIDSILAAETDPEKCRGIVISQIRESLNGVLSAMDDLEVDSAKLDAERIAAEINENPVI